MASLSTSEYKLSSSPLLSGEGSYSIHLMQKNKPCSLHRIFAHHLRTAREQSGLSQAALAEKADVSPGYIGDLELGNKFPSPYLLERLAAVFQTSAYCFLVPEDEEIQPEARAIAYDIGNQIKKAIDVELTDLLTRYAAGENIADR